MPKIKVDASSRASSRKEAAEPDFAKLGTKAKEPERPCDRRESGNSGVEHPETRGRLPDRASPQASAKRPRRARDCEGTKGSDLLNPSTKTMSSSWPRECSDAGKPGHALSTNSSGETEPARLKPKGGANEPGRAKDLSDNTDHGQVAPEADMGRPSQAALRGNKKEPKWALSTADKANTGPAQDKPNTKTVKPTRAGPARAKPDVKAAGPTRASACKGTGKPESEKRETDDTKPRRPGDRNDSGLPNTALSGAKSRTPERPTPEANAALPEQADVRGSAEDPVRANWHAGRKLPRHAELRGKSEKPGLVVAAADSRNTKPARASPVADTTGPSWPWSLRDRKDPGCCMPEANTTDPVQARPKEGLPAEKFRKPQQRHLPKQGFAEARNCQGDWVAVPAELLLLGRMNVVTGMVPKSCSQSQKERIRSHSVPDQTEVPWAQDGYGYEEVDQDQDTEPVRLPPNARAAKPAQEELWRDAAKSMLRSDKKTPECALPDTESETSIRPRPHADTELLMRARVLGGKAKPAELQKSTGTKKSVLLKLLMDSVGPGLAVPGTNGEDTKPARTSPTNDDNSSSRPGDREGSSKPGCVQPRTDTAEPVQAELLSSEAVPGHVVSAAGSRKTEPVRAKPSKETLKPERLGCCGGGEKPQVARLGTGKAGPARLSDRKGSREPVAELPGTGKEAPNQDMPHAGTEGPRCAKHRISTLEPRPAKPGAGNAKSIRTWLRTRSEDAGIVTPSTDRE
ncbi:unnamed protein product [Symbiodinium microadriaticum]|nr:unnamed protein product [Symbiodinium microadriaticum]